MTKKELIKEEREEYILLFSLQMMNECKNQMVNRYEKREIKSEDRELHTLRAIESILEQQAFLIFLFLYTLHRDQIKPYIQEILEEKESDTEEEAKRVFEIILQKIDEWATGNI